MAMPAAAAAADSLHDAKRSLEDYLPQNGSRNGISPPPTCRVDDAVAVYGARLRTWIDLQVDSRLGQVLPRLIDSELAAVRHDNLLSLEASERSGTEMRAVTQSQAKLLGHLQGISSELQQVKLAASRHPCAAGAGSEEALASLRHANDRFDLLMQRVDELARDVAFAQEASKSFQQASEDLACNVAAHREATTACLSKHEDMLGQLHRSHAQQEEYRARNPEQRVADELAALEMRLCNKCSEIMSEELSSWAKQRDQGLLMLEQDMQAQIAQMLKALENRTEQKLEALQHGISDGSEAGAVALRTEIQSLYQELMSNIQCESQKNKLDLDLGKVWPEMEDRVQVLISAGLSGNRDEFRSQITEAQVCLGEELANVQQRLIADLKAETTRGINRVNSSIAALDEQLWITDQRLGQRIDDLSHQLRGSISFVEVQGLQVKEELRQESPCLRTWKAEGIAAQSHNKASREPTALSNQRPKGHTATGSSVTA